MKYRIISEEYPNKLNGAGVAGLDIRHDQIVHDGGDDINYLRTVLGQCVAMYSASLSERKGRKIWLQAESPCGYINETSVIVKAGEL